MTTKNAAAPSLLTVQDVVENLTAVETFEIEDHFGAAEFHSLSGVRLLVGLVYVTRKRTDDTVTWDDVKRLKVSELNDYFAPEKPDSGN